MSQEQQTNIPSTMRRLVVATPSRDVKKCQFQIQTGVSVPKPASHQVLVKVAAAPLNPSDLGDATKADPDKCPLPLGREGSGVIVATGGGWSTWHLKIGQKVGIVNANYQQGLQGTYSEYFVADALKEVFAMPAELPIEDAASFCVNPYTALAILETAKASGVKIIVHTAAASQLGQMMVKVAPTMGMEIVNVVRREEQKKLLQELGATHVVVTGDGDAWKAELKSKIDNLGITMAFEAVAGSMTGDLLDLMPPKGIVYLYGRLSGPAGNINPVDLIYKKKELKGFLMSDWMFKGGIFATLARIASASAKVNAGLINGGWSSSQFKDTSLENAQQDLTKLLDGHRTGIKLRIRLDVSAST